MATAVIIQARDMIKFLEDRKFQRIELTGTKEMVFSKGFHIDLTNTDAAGNKIIVDTIPLAVRVFTSIALIGRSRDIGKDAIRVVVMARGVDGTPYPIGKDRRVHRVEGWRENLAERLDNIQRQLDPECPECAAPMVARSGANGRKFFGCIRYHSAGCRGFRYYSEEN